MSAVFSLLVKIVVLKMHKLYFGRGNFGSALLVAAALDGGRQLLQGASSTPLTHQDLWHRPTRQVELLFWW